MDNVSNEGGAVNQPTGGMRPPSPAPEGVATNKSEKNVRIFLLGLGGFLAVALVVSSVAGMYRAYAKGKTDSFTVTVAKALRLPALKVNGQTVLYSAYADDLKAIHVMQNYDKQNNNGGGAAGFSEEQLSDQVLWRLANNVLIDDAAAKMGVKAEQPDIDALKSQIMQQFKTTAEVDAELTKRYGWNFSTYIEKVMKPYVLQDKLSQKIQTDDAAREKIRQQAQDVLDQIKKGADFAEMAKKYGEDGTAAVGGDLGWFGKGDMVPQFEAAAFKLKKGELSQTLVETSYGYHIIKVVDRKVEKTKDAKGKTVSAEKIQASHILFRFASLSKYLDDMAHQADIHLYVRVHNPFTSAVKK